MRSADELVFLLLGAEFDNFLMIKGHDYTKALAYQDFLYLKIVCVEVIHFLNFRVKIIGYEIF